MHAAESRSRTLRRMAWLTLLLLLAVLAIIDIGQVVVNAGPRIVLAIATVTALALAAGHLLGGPDPATRTAVAISSAIRNPGLALLVATLLSSLIRHENRAGRERLIPTRLPWRC